MLDDEEHRQSGEGVGTPPFGWRRKNDKGGQGVEAACADWFESHTNAVPRKFGPINAAAV